ncbi:hypothetical protein BDC45DRAFT_443921, partial [Circinella umbellata]
IRRRIGRLPREKSKVCSNCTTRTLVKTHPITCLRIHLQLSAPRHKTEDPISHLLNKITIVAFK